MYSFDPLVLLSLYSLGETQTSTLLTLPICFKCSWMPNKSYFFDSFSIIWLWFASIFAIKISLSKDVNLLDFYESWKPKLLDLNFAIIPLVFKNIWYPQTFLVEISASVPRWNSKMHGIVAMYSNRYLTNHFTINCKKMKKKTLYFWVNNSL